MPRDLYDVLGVARDASEPEIRRAYRRLAREHHPDRNHGDLTAEAKFKEATEAFQVLSDPKKRQAYDAFPGNLGGVAPPAPSSAPSQGRAPPVSSPSWPPAQSRSAYEERLREPPWYRPKWSIDEEARRGRAAEEAAESARRGRAAEEPPRVRDPSDYEYNLGRTHGYTSRSDAELQAEIERLAAQAPTTSDYSGQVAHRQSPYLAGFQRGVQERTAAELARALGFGFNVPPDPSHWRAWGFEPLEEEEFPRRRRGDGTG